MGIMRKRGLYGKKETTIPHGTLAVYLVVTGDL
jgi:hypothetical protein